MLDDLLAVLPDAKTTPNGWQARCPAHDDQQASLAVAEGADGRVLVRCFAGCAFDAIVAATRLPKSAFFAPNGDAPPDQARIITTYDYRDEQGRFLFQAVRFEPKKFKQRRPDGKGDWIWDLKNTRRVLYRLPELLRAEPDTTVYIPEGEKDVERLLALGLVATCNPMGAGKWRDEYAIPLTGRPVIVLPDNDPAGRDHAITVARSLAPTAKWVKIVPLPDLPDRGDVSDYLNAGHSLLDLQALVDATRPWTPQPPGPADCETIAELADGVLDALDIAWRRKTAAVYSAKLKLEIPIAQLWLQATPEQIDAVSTTREGREMKRKDKPPDFTRRVAALRLACQLSAGKRLAQLPEHKTLETDPLLDGDQLESQLIAWLLKDRTVRRDTGNPQTITYHQWARQLEIGPKWRQCFSGPLFARRDENDDQPEIVVQGDLITEQLGRDSKRNLARDLRDAGLAEPDTVIYIEGRLQRVWKINPELLQRIAKTEKPQ